VRRRRGSPIQFVGRGAGTCQSSLNPSLNPRIGLDAEPRTVGRNHRRHVTRRSPARRRRFSRVAHILRPLSGLARHRRSTLLGLPVATQVSMESVPARFFWFRRGGTSAHGDCALVPPWACIRTWRLRAHRFRIVRSSISAGIGRAEIHGEQCPIASWHAERERSSVSRRRSRRRVAERTSAIRRRHGALVELRGRARGSRARGCASVPRVVAIGVPASRQSSLAERTSDAAPLWIGHRTRGPDRDGRGGAGPRRRAARSSVPRMARVVIS
jgi:hypothetical protein